MVKDSDKFHHRVRGPEKGKERYNPGKKPKRNENDFVKKRLKGTELEGGVELDLTGPKAYLKAKRKF